MHIAPIVGFGGDALTFLGGLLLALDTVKKESELRKIATLKDPQMARLVVEVEGVVVKSADQLESVYVHRSSKMAFWGCWLLVGGFLLLLLARVIEAVSPVLSG